MKKIITLLLITALFTSCGVTINSVAEDSAQTYSNPLVVIPYEKHGPKNFSNQLKKKIEIYFQENNKNVEVLVFEKPSNALTLNSGNEIDKKIQAAITNDEKDLLLLVQPTNLVYMNGTIQVADYQLSGLDTKTGNEVWKANFRSRSAVGPSFFANKTAKVIYDQLKEDKVL